MLVQESGPSRAVGKLRDVVALAQLFGERRLQLADPQHPTQLLGRHAPIMLEARIVIGRRAAREANAAEDG
ncbi:MULTISPECIES: hypothetical protein [unclassified Mycobacterium]|uniref:hypothetical protein n=1 Tax=unclassified Mycobacterium TaxID=2642494 RepID=UPI001CDA0EFC|nr:MULTISPECIES: hypothetical protein [unclassified Mycobacterium]